MQYLATLLAAAGVASAAAIPRDSSATFNIIEFGFSGTPHSEIADYSFNVTDGTTPSTQCIANTWTSPEISFFPSTACRDPSWSFSWSQDPSNDDASIVSITHADPVKGNVTAVRYFTRDDIKWQSGITPTGDVQYLSTGNDGGSFPLEAY